MKAVQITKPGVIKIAEVPIPEIHSNDVLIKVAYAGICGTDIHIFNGEYEAIYPIIPGHEFSGTIVKAGKKVKYFQPGDRVTVDPNIPCYRCQACKRGYFNQCENLEAVGVTRDGAFAEFVAVPDNVIFPIHNMHLQEAAMVEPLSCVVWGLKRIQPQSGDSALVIGAGPMGCLVSQALLRCGVTKVVVTDKNRYRLGIAKDLGISEIIWLSRNEQIKNKLKSESFSIVVDATGVGEVLKQAFEVVQPRGKIWVFGVVPPEETIPFSPYEVFRKDLSIIGSFAVNQTFPQAISLISERMVRVTPLISHQIPMMSFGEAIQIAQEDPHRMKVQIQVSDEYINKLDM